MTLQLNGIALLQIDFLMNPMITIIFIKTKYGLTLAIIINRIAHIWFFRKNISLFFLLCAEISNKDIYMPAMEPLCQIIGINAKNLSREENFIIELELFVQVCQKLKEIIKTQNKEYFRLMKFNADMENGMLDATLIRHVINDILVTEEYSIEGIAYYTQTPEEVICDIAAGTNPAPSLPLSRKIIELHRSVRPNLYREVMKKITSEYLLEI